MRKAKQRAINDLKYAITTPDPLYTLKIKVFMRTRAGKQIMKRWKELEKHWFDNIEMTLSPIPYIPETMMRVEKYLAMPQRPLIKITGIST